MGFISRLLGRGNEQRAATFAEKFLNGPGIFHVGMQSDTGIKVNEQVALTAAAVWGAVQIIANAVATLPCHVMKRKDGGKDYDHAIYHLLAHEPN
jgi:phage portal protein BeeE